MCICYIHNDTNSPNRVRESTDRPEKEWQSMIVPNVELVMQRPAEHDTHKVCHKHWIEDISRQEISREQLEGRTSK